MRGFHWATPRGPHITPKVGGCHRRIACGGPARAMSAWLPAQIAAPLFWGRTCSSAVVRRQGLEPRTRGLRVRPNGVGCRGVRCRFLLSTWAFAEAESRLRVREWSAVVSGGWTRNGLKILDDGSPGLGFAGRTSSVNSHPPVSTTWVAGSPSRSRLPEPGAHQTHEPAEGRSVRTPASRHVRTLVRSVLRLAFATLRRGSRCRR